MSMLCVNSLYYCPQVVIKFKTNIYSHGCLRDFYCTVKVKENTSQRSPKHFSSKEKIYCGYKHFIGLKKNEYITAERSVTLILPRSLPDITLAKCLSETYNL